MSQWCCHFYCWVFNLLELFPVLGNILRKQFASHFLFIYQQLLKYWLSMVNSVSGNNNIRLRKAENCSEVNSKHLLHDLVQNSQKQWSKHDVFCEVCCCPQCLSHKSDITHCSGASIHQPSRKFTNLLTYKKITSDDILLWFWNKYTESINNNNKLVSHCITSLTCPLICSQLKIGSMLSQHWLGIWKGVCQYNKLPLCQPPKVVWVFRVING